MLDPECESVPCPMSESHSPHPGQTSHVRVKPPTSILQGNAASASTPLSLLVTTAESSLINELSLLPLTLRPMFPGLSCLAVILGGEVWVTVEALTPWDAVYVAPILWPHTWLTVMVMVMVMVMA